MNHMAYGIMDDCKIVSTSYFWSCITLNPDCPFFTTIDPKLYYFGIGLISLYIAFMLTILIDFKFFHSLDKLQLQIDYYINLVRKKVRRVQVDQRRLMTTQERTEKQLKRSQECKRIVTVLRGALSVEDPRYMSVLTQNVNTNNNSSTDPGIWSNLNSENNF